MHAVRMGSARGCVQMATECLHQHLVPQEVISVPFGAGVGKGLDGGPAGCWYVGRMQREFRASSQACQQRQLELHPGVTTGRWKRSLISQNH